MRDTNAPAKPELENPFPAQAVMTFGPLPATYASLAFMEASYAPLKQYVNDYPKPVSPGAVQAGGAVALSGEHGSGKTYLLAWMNLQVARLEHLTCHVAYAKADGPKFSDVYRQLIRNFDRQGLQDVIAEALRHIAARLASAALATENTAQRIRSGAALEPIYAEKILDRNELYLALKKEISATGTAPAIGAKVAETIGLLEDAKLGQAAFDWLGGGGDLLGTGSTVTGPLLPTGDGPSSDAADIAIAALECFAAVFRLAERPLVLLIDQVENFVPTDQPVIGWNSVVKKLVEQAARQKVFVVLAGTRVAWDRLQRDVWPRLVQREPLVVGKLSAAETGVLLQAYLYSSHQSFSRSVVSVIHDVSGGNPREILQIAHRCFSAVSGRLDQLDAKLVFEAARDTGTLADREKLALADIDRVVALLELKTEELRLPGGALVHRFVRGPENGGVAIVLTVATDPMAEVSVAQALTEVRGALAAMPGAPELLTVAIGYSSSSVRRLVETVSHLVVFDDPDFEVRLHTELSALVLAKRQPRVEAISADSSQLLHQVLEQISNLQHGLEQLRTVREEQTLATANRLQLGVETLAEEARAAAGARTKWELLDTLDSIGPALDEGDPKRERMLVRSLLVANETSLRDPAVDYLGVLYVRVLDVYERYHNPGTIDLRRDLITSIRTRLLPHNEIMSRLTLDLFAAIPTLFVASLVITIVLFNPQFSAVSDLAKSLIVSGVLIASGCLLLFFDWYQRIPERRYNSLASRLNGFSIGR